MAIDSNGKQNIPELFLEIMKHDATRPVLDYDVTGNLVRVNPNEWKRYRKEFHEWKDRQLELISHAEKALRWNTDKGKE